MSVSSSSDLDDHDHEMRSTGSSSPMMLSDTLTSAASSDESSSARSSPAPDAGAGEASASSDGTLAAPLPSEFALAPAGAEPNVSDATETHAGVTVTPPRSGGEDTSDDVSPAAVSVEFSPSAAEARPQRGMGSMTAAAGAGAEGDGSAAEAPAGSGEQASPLSTASPPMAAAAVLNASPGRASVEADADTVRNSTLDDSAVSVDDRWWLEEEGKWAKGCEHYRRRGAIVAPCCDEVFGCRLCHDMAKDENEPDLKKAHKIDRYSIKEFVCLECNTRQPKGQVCANPECGSEMGRYYCEDCSFLDDNLSKELFHCADCRLCRVGGRERYWHCERCLSCNPVAGKEEHNCIPGAMAADCPICCDYLFDSRDPVTLLRCGHAIHVMCLRQLAKTSFRCPVCSRAFVDLAQYDAFLEEEVASTPMPHEYSNMRVMILCNECLEESVVPFHVVGHKCGSCGSFNTARTGLAPDAPDGDEGHVHDDDSGGGDGGDGVDAAGAGDVTGHAAAALHGTGAAGASATAPAGGEAAAAIGDMFAPSAAPVTGSGAGSGDTDASEPL